MATRKPRARIIPLKEWELHKEAIKELYVAQNLSKEETMKHMKNKYGFGATIKQYEHQLGEWGFRKNMNKTEWNYIYSQMDKGKLPAGRELSLTGKRISRRRVEKQNARRAVQEHRAIARVQTPPSPKELAIWTPAALSPEFSDIAFSSSFRFDNLPCLRVRRLFDSFQAGSRGSRGGSFSPNVSNRLSPPNHEDEDDNTMKWVISKLRFDPAKLGNFMKALGPSSPINTIRSFLSSVIINIANFLINDDETDEILQWITQNKLEGQLQILLDSKIPTIQVFGNALLQSAIRQGPAHIVKWLLRIGVDPNIPFPCPPRRHLFEPRHPEQLFYIRLGPVSALQRAVIANNIEIAILLIFYGANVQYEVPITRAGNYSEARKIPEQDVDFGGGLPMVEASLNGSTEMCQLLLEKGSDINCASCSISGEGVKLYLTPLQAAVKSGNASLVQFLLKKGAQVNTCSNRERSSLEYSAAQDMQITKLLLHAGAEILDEDDETILDSRILRAAVEHKNEDLVKLLMKFGVAYGLEIDAGEALQMAVDNDNVQIATILVASGADIDFRDYDRKVPTPLQWALRRRNKSLVSALLDAGVDVIEVRRCSLGGVLLGNGTRRPESLDCAHEWTVDAAFDAAYAGDKENLAMLIEAGAAFSCGPHNPSGYDLCRCCGAQTGHCVCGNAYCYRCNLDEGCLDGGEECTKPIACPPILGAVLSGNVNMVKFFISAGVRLHRTVPWRLACLSQNDDMITLLKENGADFSEPPLEYFLHRAIREGNEMNVQNYIERGVDVNSVGVEGDTPLQIACLRNRSTTNITRLLLDAGADPNKRSCIANSTALQSTRDLETAKLLISSGANVNAPPSIIDSEIFPTALQMAVAEGHRSLVTLLLDAGAREDPGDLDDSGISALEYAVEKRDKETIRQLIEHNTNVNRVNTQYKRTALSVAASKGYLDVCLQLLEAGAAVHDTLGCASVRSAAEEGHLDMLQFLLNCIEDSRNEVSGSVQQIITSVTSKGHYIAANMLKEWLAHGPEKPSYEPIHSFNQRELFYDINTALGQGMNTGVVVDLTPYNPSYTNMDNPTLLTNDNIDNYVGFELQTDKLTDSLDPHIETTQWPWVDAFEADTLVGQNGIDLNFQFGST